MDRLRRTRWYNSVALRLLALFWFLLLTAGAAAITLTIQLSQPMQPESLSSDFERSLRPVLNLPDSGPMFQPGRLLVGEYRVAARYDTENESFLFAPGLSQDGVTRSARLMEENALLQIPAGDVMLGGVFEVDDARLVISRPLTASEQDLLRQREDREWLPLVSALGAGFSLFGALILWLWFVRPLRQLRAATRELADGVAQPQLKRLPKRADELGELARTLSVTAYELATSRDAQRRLLSDVSHELRSPLARLQVALDLLATDALKDDRNFKQLEKDIFRLGNIINSILWLSRLENGIQKLVRESISMGSLLESLKADFSYGPQQEGMQSYGVRLLLPAELNKDSPLPTIATDPVLLNLVLENLIRNGFQYGPDDGKVYVMSEIEGNQLILRIKDEGPGVDEAKLDQMFVPFYRADPSRHHGAGVGLGLALSQRATAVLGGTLEARNHPEGGLEVSVSLPLDAEPTDYDDTETGATDTQ